MDLHEPAAPRRHIPRQAGFSVIELLTALCIVTILLLLAAPALSSTVTRMRLDAEVNTVLSGLNFARSEAIKRGLPVAVCPGTSNCGTVSDWSGGWLVLLPGTTTQLLQQYTPLAAGHTLTGVSTDSTPYPQFTPMGYTFFTGTLSLHDRTNTPEWRRCVVFSFGTWTTQTGSACP